MTTSTRRRTGALTAVVLAAALGSGAAFGQAGPVLSAHADSAGPGMTVGVEPTTSELRATVAADEFPGRPAGDLDDVVGTAEHMTQLATATLAAAPVPAGKPLLSTLSRHVEPSCSGTGTDGNRVQVIYAVEQGKKDRYPELVNLLRSWVADVDDTFAASAQKTGGGLRVRWVHSGCVPVIEREILPAGALSGGFSATIAAIKDRGYTSPDRKYLVFADDTKLCGIGQLYLDNAKVDNANDGAYAMYARVDSPCWTSRTGWHSVAAHELMHMLGGVQNEAPNSTKASHCHDDTDVMCYDDGGSASSIRSVCAGQEELFDCRDDDYFNTDPVSGSYLDRSWNSADSTFLDRTEKLTAGPEVAVRGRSSMRPGLSSTYTAASRDADVSYRWSASPASCLPGTRGAASVTLSCPSWRTGKVTLTLAAATPGSTTTRVKKTITLRTSPAAKISTALEAAKSRITAGRHTTVRVELGFRGSAVRGTVALYAKPAAGTWKRISADLDTGADGTHTWKIQPRTTTRYGVKVAHKDGGGWRTPKEATATVRVA